MSSGVLGEGGVPEYLEAGVVEPMERVGMGQTNLAVASAMLAMALAAPAATQDLAPELNDYPTEARAEYVFACMAVNGQNQDVLRRCSCSIDVVASILPYERLRRGRDGADHAADRRRAGRHDAHRAEARTQWCRTCAARRPRARSAASERGGHMPDGEACPRSVRAVGVGGAHGQSPGAGVGVARNGRSDPR